ncbi:hypothetical protein [Stenotrophomonas sp. YAU14D1_LEIMI4_1]|uniref:hypothetical protein n=1 Tax=Stenotrophomonas sp. YAU14D1_LEIMI4_1 TaxID=2072407 RepID=UPI00131EE6C0|nr:hypothetical protein [Stenotrophomonas sp. YAU14D1_LEIMI4_1]
MGSSLAIAFAFLHPISSRAIDMAESVRYSWFLQSDCENAMSYKEVPNVGWGDVYRGAKYSVTAALVSVIGGPDDGKYQGIYRIGGAPTAGTRCLDKLDTIQLAMDDAEKSAKQEIDRRLDSVKP